MESKEQNNYHFILMFFFLNNCFMLFLAKIICELTVYYLILGIIYIIRVLFILFNVDTKLNNTFHVLI